MMTASHQDGRRAAIEAAAYEVLLEKGYKSASMLAVARRAKASNETMYRWYGDKAGLFSALVQANAAETKERLLAVNETDPMATLAAAAPILLSMVIGEKAIALNRAAAANVAEGGELGAAIAAAGRDVIAPLIAGVIKRAAAEGALFAPDPRKSSELFIRLLIGDMQIRRVIDAAPALTPTEIQQRADEAIALLVRLSEPP